MSRNILVLFVLACVLGAGASVYYLGDKRETGNQREVGDQQEVGNQQEAGNQQEVGDQQDAGNQKQVGKQQEVDCVSQGKVVGAMNRFSFDLYRELDKDNPKKNLAFSPVSLYSALAMVMDGARGETADQMGKALRLPPEIRKTGSDATSIPWQMNSVHSGMASLHNKLNPQKSRPDFLVHMANAIWVDNTYPLTSSFKQNLDNYYKTDGVYNVDFMGDSGGAIKKINHWTDEQTHHRIKEIVKEGMVDSLTRFVLTNAIYFKGKWVEPFEKYPTKDKDFLLADGSKVKTPIMFGKKEEIRYAAFNGDGSYFDTPTMASMDEYDTCRPGEKGFEMIELPYKGGGLVMVAFLPIGDNGLDDVVKILAKKKFDQWFTPLVKRNVYVGLPRFKLEISNASLIKNMKKMGMVNAFIPNDADFGGLSTSTSAIDRVFISFISQKVFIEVNESGTVATAITVGGGGGGGFKVPYTPSFWADHPFLYFIVEKETKAILFMGRISDPKGFALEDSAGESDAEQGYVQPNS